MTRVRRLGVAGLALALLLTGCTAAPEPEPTWRPVTGEEAQILAVARFNNFDAGSRPFVTEVGEGDETQHVQGWVDYSSQVGYAAASDPEQPQTVLWTSDSVGFLPADPDADGNPVLPIPPFDDTWQTAALAPSDYALDAVLAVLSGLGSDRPDNPLLVQQSGTLWLGRDEVDGVAVTVFAAPPTDEVRSPDDPPLTPDSAKLRLAVDDEGLLRRADVQFRGDWITIDLPDAPAPALTLPTP